MRICGVELAGNEAIVCLMQLENHLFTLPDCRVRKFTLPKAHSRDDLQQFQFAFAKLLADYKVNKVAIKERMPKGKFAGGAVSFKLEAAIQLISNVTVYIEIITPSQIKAAISQNPLTIPFADTDLKAFQEDAFRVAYAAHMPAVAEELDASDE